MSAGDRARAAFLHLPPSVQRRVLHRMGRYAPWEPEFDFTPPAPRTGEVTGAPDFVGIGVQKAGTTWWYELLASHPDVSSPEGLHKERHFFDRFGDKPFGPPDIERYHAWFPRRTGSLTGEWTPDYLSLPWVAPLLAAAAPSARLLVLLRDPIDRFRSGLDHQARMGQPASSPSVADAMSRGFYHQALTQWLRWFPAEQLMILQYERCVADPARQYRETTRFLGLADHRPPAVDGPRPPARARAELDPEVTERLRDAYEPDVRALAKLAPQVDLHLWPHFSYLADDGPNSPTLRP